MTVDTKRQKEKVEQEVDGLIKQHVNSSEDKDENGTQIASVAAADKMQWAKSTGANLQLIDQRLNAVCHEVPEVDGPIAVPRYRLR